MQIRIFVGLLLLCINPALHSQTLVSSTLLGTNTRAQLTAKFNLPFIQFGVSYYRIAYTTTGLQGEPDTVSGLLAVPDDLSYVFPRLVYQHGTSSSQLDVPSFNVLQTVGEGDIGLLFAGMGFVSLLPDYLGLGISDGYHPYVHAESEAQVGVDMLRILPEFANQHGIHINDQLFITGYSQGGHASMALHREIETNLSPTEFEVSAAAHLSGPYSIGEVMREMILSDTIYQYPAYIPNTILSYQTVYGNLFNELSEVFKEPYATAIEAFYTGGTTAGQLNSQLRALLNANEGSSRPKRMLQPDIIQAVENNPDHPFNLALKDNNVYAWAPQAPTRILYCMADDQVPFRNSLVARDTMMAYGAADLVVSDLDPTADHGECVEPALTNTLFFFLGYADVSPFTSTGAYHSRPLAFYPNPAQQLITLQNLAEEGLFQAFDIRGQLVLSRQISAGDKQQDISSLENGVYLIRLLGKNKIWQGRLVVQP